MKCQEQKRRLTIAVQDSTSHFSIGMLLHAYLEAVTIPNNRSFRASLEARTFNSEPSVNSTDWISRHENPQQHCNNVLKTCRSKSLKRPERRVATLHNPHPQAVRSKSTGALQSLGLLSNPLTPESMAELGSQELNSGNSGKSLQFMCNRVTDCRFLRWCRPHICNEFF